MLRLLQIEFEELGHAGPDHCRLYNFRVVVGDMQCDQGSGRNKKDAKREAAAIALKSLGYQVSVGKKESFVCPPRTISPLTFRVHPKLKSTLITVLILVCLLVHSPKIN